MVFSAKYRKKIFDDAIDKTLKYVCLEISERYEIHFLEIDNDVDYVHFLVQSVSTLTVTRIKYSVIRVLLYKEIEKKEEGT